MKRWLRALVIVLLGMEILARLAPAGFLPALGEGENFKVEFDQELGWRLPAGGESPAVNNRRMLVNHNSQGFRDHEWQGKTKPRLLFLGDSFIWGFDVEDDERLTNHIQGKLPEWEVLNAGVVGYGTDQELLLIKRLFPRLQPDVVFLLYVGINDVYNNTSNNSYGLFKPYYEKEGTKLKLRGVPVKRSLLFDFRNFNALFRYSYLLRGVAGVISALQPGQRKCEDLSFELILEIKSFVESNGAKFVLGYESIPPELLERLTQANISPINLITDKRYDNFGLHWTKDGHKWASDKLWETLVQNGLVVSDSP